jgi:hypothetical protein
MNCSGYWISFILFPMGLEFNPFYSKRKVKPIKSMPDLITFNNQRFDQKNTATKAIRIKGIAGI